MWTPHQSIKWTLELALVPRATPSERKGGRRGLLTIPTGSCSREMQKNIKGNCKSYMHGQPYVHAPQVRHCLAINLIS